MVHTALAVAAALVALAFALSTFERWLARRRRHELAWSVALAMFAVAAGSLAAGAALGWSGPAFRLYFAFGAVANVPVLALGTVYLLAPPRAADRVAATVGLLVAFAVGTVMASPLTRPLPVGGLPQGSDVFTLWPRLFAAVGSGLGALVIIGGAVWSAVRFRRGRMVWSNLVIAAGTLILSGSGLLNSVLGAMDAFVVTLALGISVVFAGFLVATTGGRAARQATGSDPQRGLRAVS
jgi:hypothetical protein